MVQLGSLLDDEEGVVLVAPPQKYSLRKSIKPFICSTPDDFTEEREFLSQKIFPQINELCMMRGCRFSPVDIPWGMQDDQIATGHLLRLNLEYICKSLPYFLCLLGERYGPYRPVDSLPLPKKVTQLPEYATSLDRNYLVAASAGYEWVLQEHHQNNSLTELEIIHATFLNDCDYCHFYFRQPEHLDKKFGHLSDEARQKLSKPYLPVNEYADLNIRDLKQRIVNKGLPVKYFKVLEELGVHVIKDWTKVIDLVYPPLEYPVTTLDTEDYQEWVCNEMFAESRRKVFVNSVDIKTLHDEMTTFAKAALDDPPEEVQEEVDRFKSYSIVTKLKKKKPQEVKYKSMMLIHGDRGSGKSTLVANWLPGFKASHPDLKVISHFVGSSHRSTNVAVFLKQCIKELREEYLRPDTEVDKPRITEEDQPWSFEEVSQAFVSALSLGPCVIVLDGIDELGLTLSQTNRQIKEFKWLPFPLPPQCRFICTTCRSDLSYHAMTSRRDIVLHPVPLLDTDKLRRNFLEEHMQHHFMYLKPVDFENIHSLKACNNLLYLNILCNEMQTFNVHTHLTQYLDDVYDNCASLRELCVHCFQRWTKDYSWQKENLYGDSTELEPELEFEGWVPDVLRLFAVSKMGLTETDLFALLQRIGYTGSRIVKKFDWLQFRTCLGNLLYEGPDGRLVYAHQHFKEIVEYVLLHSFKSIGSEVTANDAANREWRGEKQKFHIHMTKYFKQLPFSNVILLGLPHQLLMAGDFEGLSKALMDPVIINGFLNEEKQCPSNKLDLAYYWSVLAGQGIDITSTYTQLLTSLGVLDDQSEDGDGTILVSENGDALSVSTLDENGEVFRPHVFTNVPRIITSSPHEQRTLSVIEETSSVADSFRYGEEGEDELPRITISEAQNGIDTIFLTESKTSITSDQGPKEIVLTSSNIKLAFMIACFLKDTGHHKVTDTICRALNDKLDKNYPLSEDDQLLHARVQEMLGQFSKEVEADMEQTEKWFRRALRTVMDISDLDIEEGTPKYYEITNLKGRLLNHHGNLRLQQGSMDIAEDLLKEALDCVTSCGNLATRATILYHLGILRSQQFEFLLGESCLRQSLLIREQWYGRTHPLVADILYVLAGIMGNPQNIRGYDKVAAETVYRRSLEIRETCLGATHLSVSDILMELAKLVQEESSQGAKGEAVKLLQRALDIKTTHLGGDHIDTRAVRSYLSKLEVTLKMGRYEFGPAKPTDVRSVERPYSNMSWREKDIINFERRAKSRSSSRGGSSVYSNSRPDSGKNDASYSQLSRHSSLSFLSASEKLMLESERPRLLQRGTLDRRLRTSSPKSTNSSPDESSKKVEINLTSMQEEAEDSGKETRVADPQIDSFADDIGGMDRTTLARSVGKQVTTFDVPDSQDFVPVRLYKRYGSAGSSRSVSPRQPHNSKTNVRSGSAKSGSSYITSASRMSRTTHSSMRSRSVMSPHAITPGNTRSITYGPNSDVSSLLGPPSTPRDIKKEYHHRSAWYHVPGRYTTYTQEYPSKRSQKTLAAQAYQNRFTSPSSNSERRKKTPPSKPVRHQQNGRQKNENDIKNEADNFGPTVKGIGPVCTDFGDNGYHDNLFTTGGPGYERYQAPSNNHGISVTFKEAVVVD
ncbi:putative tetratricopeptide repeat protein 41 isoform X2 [Ylistrum balloti]|uniref:putative tetratricopeptide repeat protein 41 isoform X2 n=1 Tax=Ylistrum balloti TaxID=509963 RepID=UPI002905DB3A|nr:putative tetratricopeptide repeat protein 41 isoform X2 [Ylistrum balloti]